MSSNGKLSLRVESSAQARHSSGTQTTLSRVIEPSQATITSQGYVGQYRKGPAKQQAPSKPVRKHRRKTHQDSGEARSG